MLELALLQVREKVTTANTQYLAEEGFLVVEVRHMQKRFKFDTFCVQPQDYKKSLRRKEI